MRTLVSIISVFALGCGGADRIRTIVIRAEVTSTCADDAGCSTMRVDVGHCGPGVSVPESSSSTVRVSSRLTAAELGAAVVVRHSTGDKPSNAGNGGSTRGWIVAKGGTARVEALHQPQTILYSVGESGEPMAENALVGRDGGVLLFRYTANGTSVVETHQLTEVSDRPLEILSPDDISNSCCAAVPTGDLTVIALLGFASIRRRR